MDLPGNSNTGKEEKKKAPDTEKVVEETAPLVLKGEVVKRRRPLSQRFKDVFFGGDFKGAMKHVASATVAPAIRNLIFDTGVEALKRTIFPNMDPRQLQRSQSLTSRITYHTPVNRDPREDPRRDPRAPMALSASTDIPDIGLTMREDAEMILDGLMEKIDRGGFATVGDLYFLLGWPRDYTDEYRGWSKLGDTQISQTRDGYVLRLPRTELK